MCNFECDSCLHSNRCTHFEQQLDNEFANCHNYLGTSPDDYCVEDENGFYWLELSYYKYKDNLFDYVLDTEVENIKDIIDFEE